MNTYKNINQQLLRFEKLNSEDFFLLGKSNDENKLIFNICGSTKNVYETKIYFKSKMIFCNCPDAKSWAKKYGVICKHSCFVLFKVLRLKIDKLKYFNILIFDDEQMQEIKNSYFNLNLSNFDEDFLNKNYSLKFEELKNKDKNTTHEKKNIEQDEFCAICYEDLDKDKDNKQNFECKTCLKILHNKCINKWISMGNNSCPYCRSIIKSVNNKYFNLN